MVGRRSPRRVQGPDFEPLEPRLLLEGADGSQSVSPVQVMPPDPAADEVPFTDIGANLAGTTDCSLAWGDYDNDGDLDLALSGKSVSSYISLIYRNDAGLFTDIEAAVAAVYGSSLAWGDYDNDGDLDLALAGTASGGGTITCVYRNDAGAFTDIGAGLAGVFRGSLAWGDYDNDGDLDLALAGAASGGAPIARICRNDGGAFADTGAALAAVSDSSLAWGDYDNDGDLDLALAGYADGTGPITRVYRNDGEAFTDIVAGLPGVASGSLAWGDYDNDGDLDLALAGSLVGGVYRNDAGTFTDIGAALPGVQSCSLAWGDFENDVDLDLALAGHTGSFALTQVYRTDAHTFTDANAGLVGVHDCSLAWGDYDNDGDLDLAVAGSATARIYRNNSPTHNTPPQAPTGLSAALAEQGIRLSWSAPPDAQTPRPGLSYNIRIGTSPGAADVLGGMADASTGWRRLPAVGNAQQGLFGTIQHLPSGTYYWSVQAIDGAFAGSRWAAEATFTVAGEIRGCKYNDINGDGDRDDGEPGLRDWPVYIDANGNGSRDEGERQVLTDADGNYVLESLLPGTYTVREGRPPSAASVDDLADYAVLITTDGRFLPLVEGFLTGKLSQTQYEQFAPAEEHNFNIPPRYEDDGSGIVWFCFEDMPAGGDMDFDDIQIRIETLADRRLELTFVKGIAGYKFAFTDPRREVFPGYGNLISGLPPLTLQVGPIWDQTAPHDSAHTVTMDIPGQTFDGRDFGNTLLDVMVLAPHVFYNNSAFDDESKGLADVNAIAPDKLALRPGDPATFANYTSYSRGLNGVILNIAGRETNAALSDLDFEFLVGNSDDLGHWSHAPPPLSVEVDALAGPDGADRVTIIWPDNAIERCWLRVTVLANERTGLAEADVFYFGNAIGECGNEPGKTAVDSGDRLGARANPRGAFNPAPIDFAYDYNRDSLVDSGDRLIARANATSAFTCLKLITAPPAALPPTEGKLETRSTKSETNPKLEIPNAPQDSKLEIRSSKPETNPKPEIPNAPQDSKLEIRSSKLETNPKLEIPDAPQDSKLEIRSSKLETNPKLETCLPDRQVPSASAGPGDGVLALAVAGGFGIWDFEFVSDFGFRVSDLPASGASVGRRLDAAAVADEIWPRPRETTSAGELGADLADILAGPALAVLRGR